MARRYATVIEIGKHQEIYLIGAGRGLVGVGEPGLKPVQCTSGSGLGIG